MNFLKKIILPLCVLLLYSLNTSAANVTKFTLDNGLVLLVKPDHRAPVFIIQTWYNIGASDEPLGITGVSHILEHMMFKGTKNYGAGEFSKIIAKNGGNDNAFTSKSYTAYYQSMGKDKLGVALKLEADRMQNLQLKPKDFNSERSVVIEERRLRTQDRPVAKLYEQFNAQTFDKKGAYHYPVIGLMADLENMPLSALQTWYQRYYHPNNAVIVIVGDVKPKQALAKVKQYFAKLPQRKIGKHILKSYPIKNQHASITLKAKLAYFVRAYFVPSLLTDLNNGKDAYALEVLSCILDGDDNSRLHKTLVRNKQLVSSIAVSYPLYDKHQTRFSISFTPSNGVSIAQVNAEIDAQIQDLKTNLIDKKELARLFSQAEASHIYAQDSISSQAYYLGMFETVGLGYKTAQDYVAKLRQVSPQDIQRVARKYLLNKQSSSIELIPDND